MTYLIAAIQPSLFSPPQTSALGAGGQWMEQMLLGEIAGIICVIAVAFVGLMMLSGRLPLRQGVQVVMGCFVLLGAPAIAAAFLGAVEPSTAPPLPQSAQALNDAQGPREELPPANYDPYAGASLRRD